MKLTRNMKIYAASGAVSSAVFFYLLDRFIAAEQWTLVWVVAVVYGLDWFLLGLVLGRSDKTRDYRGNMGLAYHLIATVVTLTAAAAATVLLTHLTQADLMWATVIMAASFGMHYLGTRGQTKGIDKNEAFK